MTAKNKVKVLSALLLTSAALLSGCSNTSDDSATTPETTATQESAETTTEAQQTLEELVSEADLQVANTAASSMCPESTFSNCAITTEKNVLVTQFTYAVDPSSVTTVDAAKASLEANKASLGQQAQNELSRLHQQYPNLSTAQVAYRYLKPDGSFFIEMLGEEDGTCNFSE